MTVVVDDNGEGESDGWREEHSRRHDDRDEIVNSQHHDHEDRLAQLEEEVKTLRGSLDFAIERAHQATAEASEARATAETAKATAEAAVEVAETAAEEAGEVEQELAEALEEQEPEGETDAEIVSDVPESDLAEEEPQGEGKKGHAPFLRF